MTTVMTALDLNARRQFGASARREAKGTGVARRVPLLARPFCNDDGAAQRILRLADSRGPRSGSAECQERASNTATVPTSLIAAARDVGRITRFEQLAYVALSAGSVISIGVGFAHAEKMMAGWSIFTRLVEGILS